MIKAVLFDVDGVVIKKHGYFSDRYSLEYNISRDKIMQFFKNEFGECTIGKADLKEVLPLYLKEWGWTGSVDEFLEYWFSGEKEVSEEILDIIKDLRDKGIICALATNNEKYRMKYLLNEIELKDKFDEVFASSSIGYKKPAKEFFDFVTNQLNLDPDEILFWDSAEEVVEGAKEYGLHAELYTSFELFEKAMNNLGI